MTVPSNPITPMFTVLGLTRQQEAILTTLWEAQGNGVLSPALGRAAGANANKESIRVQMHRIRSKLPDHCISNRYGSGYYLTPKGIEVINKLMGTTK